MASGEGLKIQPDNVRAIVEMPEPEDITAVQRLVGVVTYLSKFVPRLTEITGPLRDLTRQDTDWTWGPAQKKAFKQVKDAVSSVPVLRYNSLDDEVTLKCVASQSDIGATLMQMGQPVAFTSRALTSAETRCAQIEKELLAIMYACEKFDAYVHGRDEVAIQMDHKPLESIFKKLLNGAPMRLQRRLLRRQRYYLKGLYHKGTEMYMTDALSRAYLPVTVTDGHPWRTFIQPCFYLSRLNDYSKSDMQHRKIQCSPC